MMEVVLDVQAQLAHAGPWSSWGQDLRCQQAQACPPWEWCPAPRNPTCRWFGDVQSITRCLLLPTSSQEVSWGDALEDGIIQGP